MDTKLKSISKLCVDVNELINKKVEEGLQHEVENIFGYWDRSFIVIPIWESISISAKRKIFYSDSRK